MPNVVSILSKEEHAALRERAKANRRSLGSQLVCEAFASIGRQAPHYISSKRSKKRATKATA